MKNSIKIYMCTLFVMSAICGCQKERVMFYTEQKAGVMFLYDRETINRSEQDTLFFSFALKAPGEESILLDLPVTYTGYAEDRDRKVEAVTIKEPTDPRSKYELLSGTVESSAMAGAVRLRLWNTPNLESETDTITLQLVESSDFSVKYVNSSYRHGDKLCVVFNNILSKPLWWGNDENYYLGNYTEQKLRIIQEVMGTIDNSPIKSDSSFLPEWSYNIFMLNKHCTDNNIVDKDNKPVRFAPGY